MESEGIGGNVYVRYNDDHDDLTLMTYFQGRKTNEIELDIEALTGLSRYINRVVEHRKKLATEGERPA